MKKILFLFVLSFSCLANAGNFEKIGCGNVISITSAPQKPVITDFWLNANKTANGTSGIASQIISSIPGVGFLAGAFATTVTEAVIDSARNSVAPAPDERNFKNVYLVKFQFDDGQIIDIPVYKDNYSLFAKNRTVLAVYKEGDVVEKWAYPSASFDTPSVGAENYEKVCKVQNPVFAQSQIEPYLVKTKS